MGLGIRLRELMEMRGTNARELSNKIGVPEQSIYSLIKRDSNKVDIDTLIAICETLGVTTEYFSELRPKKEEEKGYYENAATASVAQELFENANLRLLFDAAKDATPEDIMTTYTVLMALKKKEKND